MDALYERSLGPLPKSDSKSQWMKQPYERYHWFLAVAVLLLLAEEFFPERQARHNTKNQMPRAGSNTGAAAATMGIALLTIFFVSASAIASPSSALRDYKAGKFTDAQKEFERLAETNSADARLVFDAGDAAYRATNYDEALKCFTAALASPDVKMQQQAYFNIGDVQYRLGENAKDLDGVQQQWEQAIKSFQNAVALDTNDVNAAHNLEFTKKSVAMIEQLREAARLARQEADSAVRQRNYHRALEIMEQAVQKNIAAKQFQDYVKRLKNIDEIATPNPNQH
jgi:tetratricopeptide (TPR) repeat protein